MAAISIKQFASMIEISPALELTVGAVEKMIEARIRNGEYPVGSRLPTVRELAHELGINKNTAVRAYQALRRKGYLDLGRGRGAFVRSIEPLAAAANSRWLLKLDQLIEYAKEQSLSRSVVMHEFSASVNRVYGEGSGELRIAFVECNPPDIEMLADQISAAIGRRLQGVMLDELVAHPEETAARFDLIVTTFFHLGEVSWALPETLRAKVIGVLAKPTHDTLLNIARLRATVIGLVVTLASTIDNLEHIIHTYHPAATILPAQVDDDARLRLVFAKADALVVTRVTYDRLMQLQPPLPVIIVTFTIDQQSIDFLRTRIWEKEGTLVLTEAGVQIDGIHAL